MEKMAEELSEIANLEGLGEDEVRLTIQIMSDDDDNSPHPRKRASKFKSMGIGV